MSVNYLTKNQELTSVRDICRALNIPFDTVSKVMQCLNSVGIVGAEKGINGGYFLKTPLNQINLFDFCRLVEQKELLRQCSDGPCDHVQSCNIGSSLHGLNQLVGQFFKQISLEELLSSSGKLIDTTKLEKKLGANL